VVERGSLENCCTLRGTGGSNPSLSAFARRSHVFLDVGELRVLNLSSDIKIYPWRASADAIRRSLIKCNRHSPKGKGELRNKKANHLDINYGELRQMPFAVMVVLYSYSIFEINSLIILAISSGLLIIGKCPEFNSITVFGFKCSIAFSCNCIPYAASFVSFIYSFGISGRL
jgi:hypothetical protein